MLRAFHVYADNERVAKQVAALRAGDFATFLALVDESGRSSWEYLQNVIPAGYTKHQEVAVTIAAAKHLLAGEGAVRVHGARIVQGRHRSHHRRGPLPCPFHPS